MTNPAKPVNQKMCIKYKSPVRALNLLGLGWPLCIFVNVQILYEIHTLNDVYNMNYFKHNIWCISDYSSPNKDSIKSFKAMPINL